MALVLLTVLVDSLLFVVLGFFLSWIARFSRLSWLSKGHPRLGCHDTRTELRRCSCSSHSCGSRGSSASLGYVDVMVSSIFLVVQVVLLVPSSS